MCGQKSPLAKGKIDNAFARLDRLGLGKDSEDVADAREVLRRADLFTSVTLTHPHQPCTDAFLAPWT